MRLVLLPRSAIVILMAGASIVSNTPAAAENDPSVLATIRTGWAGRGPEAAAVNPNTSLIYVVNADSEDVAVIDGSSDAVLTNVSVGEHPRGIAANPTTNRIYVANWDATPSPSSMGRVTAWWQRYGWESAP